MQPLEKCVYYNTNINKLYKYLNHQNSLCKENNCTQCSRGTETNYKGKNPHQHLDQTLSLQN